MRPLKMEKRLSPVRAAEPKPKEAWLYTKCKTVHQLIADLS